MGGVPSPARVTPRPTLARRTARFAALLARTRPAIITSAVFLALIATATGLLSLPIATATGVRAPLPDALFTAVSATCVTGLTTVNTATYWSVFGHAVLAVAIFVGGLGVMTLAGVLALAVSRHLGLTQRMLTSSAQGQKGMSDNRQIVTGVLVLSGTFQGIIFLLLFIQLLRADMPLRSALGRAAFMAISAFNNAGFVIFEGADLRFLGSWGFMLPIFIGATVGAVGFPVWRDIVQRPTTPRRWTLHTKLTLSVFFPLMLFSMVSTALLEWHNPRTMGPMPLSEKLLAATMAGIDSRSLGISPIDPADMRDATQLLTDLFMFIGGGSVSTAGGIKVTTLAVLALAVIAEARGSHDIEVFRRRLPFGTLRLSVSVLVIALAIVLTTTFALLLMTDFGLEEVLFETISAFGTVGLSTGLSAVLPVAGKVLLALLMLVGRLGPMTIAATLALQERRRLIRMPESQPIVG